MGNGSFDLSWWGRHEDKVERTSKNQANVLITVNNTCGALLTRKRYSQFPQCYFVCHRIVNNTKDIVL